MKRKFIGELEELILLAVGGLADQEPYAVAILNEIKAHSNRILDVTAIHSVLRRLEKKGLVRSEMGSSSPERGGRRKRLFSLTPEGRRVLDENMAIRLSMYKKLPRLNFFGLSH